MLKQTIIDRYISKEILISWFAVFTVLTLIITGSTLGQLFAQAAEGSLPTNVVFTLLANSTVRYSIQLMPISLFIGILFAMGRFYKDSEMVSMFACGVSYKKLYRPLLFITIPLLVITTLTNLFLVPGLRHEYYALEEAVEDKVDITGVVAGRFTPSKGDKPSIFFMESRDDLGRMHNVFLHQFGKEKQASIETSKTASYFIDDTDHKFIIFENGIRYVGNPGQADYQSIEYKRHGVYVEDSDPIRKRIKRNEIPTTELWGSDKISYRAEFQWRLAVPIVTVVLALLAVPLSHTSPRKGRFSKMGHAIIIYILYSNLLIVATSWMEKSKTPDWIGIWWVHLIFISLASLLLMKRTQFHKSLIRK